MKKFEVNTLIKFMDDYGEIVENATTHRATWVRVNSPKVVWRHQQPEWLKFMPGMMAPAARAAAVANVEQYMARCRTELQQLATIRDRWIAVQETTELNIGTLVQIKFWYGLVEDIARSENHTLLLISSPRQIASHRDLEWIELDRVVVASKQAALNYIEISERMVRDALAKLTQMRERWQNGALT